MILARGEDVGPEHHRSGLVDAVHVAERRGEHVAAVLAEPELQRDRQHVFGRRVELLVDLADDTVFFAADDACFDLEDDVRVGAPLEQRTRIARFSSSGKAEPSNMCDWNRGVSPRPTRSSEIATSGSTNRSSLSAWQ